MALISVCWDCKSFVTYLICACVTKLIIIVGLCKIKKNRKIKTRATQKKIYSSNLGLRPLVASMRNFSKEIGSLQNFSCIKERYTYILVYKKRKKNKE